MKFISLGNVRIKMSNIKNYGTKIEEYTETIKIEKSKLGKCVENVGILLGLAGTLGDKPSLNELGCIMAEEKIDKINKKRTVLYITTYQNDNFIFKEGEVNFNIFDKLRELDNYFNVR